MAGQGGNVVPLLKVGGLGSRSEASARCATAALKLRPAPLSRFAAAPGRADRQRFPITPEIAGATPETQAATAERSSAASRPKRGRRTSRSLSWDCALRRGRTSPRTSCSAAGPVWRRGDLHVIEPISPFAVPGRRSARARESPHPRAERRDEDGRNSEGERAPGNDGRRRGVRAARLPLREGACAAGRPRRHHHRGGMLRHLRRRLESLRRGAFVLGRRRSSPPTSRRR